MERVFIAEGLERRVLLSASLSFATVQSFATGTSPWSIAVGDVNGDGIPDLAVANQGSDTVSVLLGNANGTFAPPQSFAAGGEPFSVAIADLNGDGKPDLIVGDIGGISILHGNADGTFQAPMHIATGGGPTSVAVASDNGSSDVIVANDISNTVTVLRDNGHGVFAAPVTYATGQNPDSVTVADLNGDGNPDLIITNDTDGTVSILMGNGNGTFHSQQTFETGREPHSVAVADLDRDGKLDLVVTNYLDNTLSVLMGNGDGTFQPQQTEAAGAGPWAVAVADVNGDGKADLFVTNSGADSVGVLLGNGDGTFSSQQTFAVGGDPHAVVVSDGELLVANAGSNSVSLLANDASQDSPIVPTFSRFQAPALAVASAAIKTKLSIILANHGASVHGRFTVNLYANTLQVLGNDNVLLASLVKKNLTLKAGKATVLELALTSLPSALPAGKYYLVAEVTDPAGLTNFVASAQTVQVAAPFVQPSVTAGQVKPATLRQNKTATVSITVTNMGDVEADGPLEITLNPSSDGSTPESDIILATLSRRVKITAGKSATYQLHLKETPALTPGTYSIFMSVSLAGVSVTKVSESQFTVVAQ